MWNLVKGRSAYIRRLEQDASLVIISDDGQAYGLVTDRLFSLFGVGHGEKLGSVEMDGKIHAAKFYGQDQVLLAGEFKQVHLWHVNGSRHQSLQHEKLHARIRQLAVVDDHCIVATSEGTVQIWNLNNYQLVADTHAGQSRITCLAATSTAAR